MRHIKILPPDLIAKIAAGEVIERPASVVKELVENSLDAGADAIDIALTDAGKTLIRVKDNGRGIAPNDLEHIFQRHATSKIQTTEDLYNIMSMGFRGEALYSIAAVADIVLRTCPDTQSPTHDQGGMELHLRGGQKIDTRPCALPGHGTEIEVKELFFNTPARRKFMKSNTTEMNQILNLFVPYTLLHPSIRFRLRHQDKDLFDLSSAPDHLNRAASVLHLDSKYLMTTRKNLLGQSGEIHLVLGDMNIQRSRRDMQFIFVNNRPVQNKSIGFHMNQIYKLIMPDSKYPFFAVFINIPPDEVDVNIHPAKREVKIRDEQGLCQILRALTEQALMTGGQPKQIAESEWRGVDKEAQIARNEDPGGASQKQNKTGLTVEAHGPASLQKNSENPTNDKSMSGRSQQNDFYIPSDTQSAPKETLAQKLEQARYVGTFLNKYLLFEAGRSLLLIDQHAAAERITFEALIRQMEKNTLEVQPLLSPELVNVTVQQMLAWEELRDKLLSLGFDTNPFDEHTLAIQSYPALIKNPVVAVENILAGEEVFSTDKETLARRACRGSVMTGDRLSLPEIDSLVKQLRVCFDPFTCPHGRPTVVEIKEDFLAKNFFRQ